MMGQKLQSWLLLFGCHLQICISVFYVFLNFASLFWLEPPSSVYFGWICDFSFIFLRSGLLENVIELSDEYKFILLWESSMISGKKIGADL